MQRDKITAPTKKIIMTLQVAQHNRELVDGWRGRDDWRPGPREPVPPLVARIASLRNDVARAVTASPANSTS